MPVGRVTAEQLARAVADQYAEAERLMTERIARNLAKGLQAPTWAQAKQAQMRLYQAQMQQLIAETERKAGKAAGGAMAEAYKQGGLQAVADLARQGTVPTGVDALAGLRAIERLTEETLGYLRATSPRVLRSTLACYADATSAGSMAGRQIVADGVGQVVLGAQTRTQAVQGVMNKFAKGGITGFVDKAGKAWNLTSYTEMAMRAGITTPAVAADTDDANVASTARPGTGIRIGARSMA